MWGTMILPAYVISLPGSDRRPIIAAHLAAHKLPFRFWDGVLVPADAEGRRQLLLSYAPDMDPSKVTLTDGSLGTLLSYVGLWRHLHLEHADDATLTLILEDDVVCNPGVDFAGLDFNTVASALMGPTDYCFLHWYPCRPTGAQAQLVSRRSVAVLDRHAQAILERNSPVDLMLWMNCPAADELRVGDTYRGGAGPWLFRHAHDYDNQTLSERMRINLARHGTASDYA